MTVIHNGENGLVGGGLYQNIHNVNPAHGLFRDVTWSEDKC